MLLIGFSWIIFACIAGIIVTKVAPGRWEDRGPTVIMLTSVAAAFAGMVGMLVVEGINGYGPPSGSPALLGVALSALGAIVAFVAYTGYVRRQPQA